ncbi:MAG: PIG-L family deacetylase [bacterium]|nr:PIG-L family deacetylase [bacterium]
MQKLNLNKNKTALIVVAHPDDETIWMGATILMHKNADWTIFSLCRAKDIDRAPKFRRVCEFFGARSIMTDLDDEDKLTIPQTLPVIKKLILEKIGNKNFDCIFTHGSNGEYGHPRHKGVHRAIVALVKKNELKTKNLYCFHYKKTSDYKLASAANADIIIKLTAKQLNQKKKVMTQIYGFAPDGIDTEYCTNPESFKAFNI